MHHGTGRMVGVTHTPSGHTHIPPIYPPLDIPTSGPTLDISIPAPSLNIPTWLTPVLVTSNGDHWRPVEDIGPFMGLLILLFWTFGDVCPGFQSQCGFPFLRATDSSDSPLVQHLLSSWLPSRFDIILVLYNTRCLYCRRLWARDPLWCGRPAGSVTGRGWSWRPPARSVRGRARPCSARRWSSPYPPGWKTGRRCACLWGIKKYL